MATYLLNCTVCEKNFGTSETWTRHLFQEEHQEKARLECWKWEESTKKCALAIFFNSPIKMETGSSIVMLLWNHLKITVGGKRKGASKGKSPSLLITDLVWWRERPNILILQFESRETADQVYSEMTEGGQCATPEPAGVKLGNYFVQCRKLVALVGLEWRSVNKETIQDSRTPPQPSTSPGSPPVKKRKITASSSSVSSSSVPSPTASSPCLVTEFNRVLRSMEVPSSTILEAKQIIEKLRRLMATKYPLCHFLIFRNIYLKIRHPFCNDLLIFANGGITPASPQSYLELDVHEIAKYVMVLDFSLDYKNEKDPKYKASQFFKQGPLDFWVITDQAYLVEVKLNQLLEYMLSFDPRCALLLSCVHYFCTLNSCYFGEFPAKGEAIEWLLIFFLSKEKIIPTVRQILEQPHQLILLPNSERNVDIGFSTYPAFASKWRRENGTKLFEGSKEKFVCDVLKVFQNFLSFLCKMLPDRNFILNTKDAELLNRRQPISQPKENWITKLTEEEMELIKSHPANVGGEFSKWPFTIVHPLVVHFNLGYNAGEFHGATKIMKRGVFQLNEFLCRREEKGSWPDTFKDLESVLKVEDVSKEGDQKLGQDEAPNLVKETTPKFAWEMAWEKAQRKSQRKAERKVPKEEWKLAFKEARKQALMETRKVIRTEAWKENWVEVRMLVGDEDGDWAEKEARSEVYEEAWKKAQMEAREKMKLVRVEEQGRKLK